MNHVTVLGSSGATTRLLPGLLEVLPEEKLHVIVNVGDDCEAWGLYVCPHIDAVLYTLAGEFDPFREDPDSRDTHHCFERARKLGMPAPFRIGDRALAFHLFRSRELGSGARLAAATSALADRLGVGVRVMPAANHSVATEIVLEDGAALFQEYAAKETPRPEIRGIRYRGADAAEAPVEVIESILGASRVILASSDPMAGIGPILAIPGVLEALHKTKAMVIAISPVIGSHAFGVWTPALLRAAGAEVSPLSVAERYREFLDFFVIHTSDVAMIERIRELGVQVWTENTVIGNVEEARRLAVRLSNEERLASPRAR